MTPGEEGSTPRARSLGPRTLMALGVLLALVVGGIMVSVFRGSGTKATVPPAPENPERPNAPRFLERKPAGEAEDFAAAMEARRREQDERRRELRERLARGEPAPARDSSPFFLGRGSGGTPAPEIPSETSAREPVATSRAGSEEELPPGVYRPYPVRTSRSLAPSAVAESKSQSSLARALEAPILLGSAKDQGDEAGASGRWSRAPLTPPSPPDFRSLLAQLRAGASTAEAPAPVQAAKPAPAVDFGRVVWAPAILLTALSSESPGPAEAWIEEDAKDRQGRVVLPRGSRVFGTYETGLALGQKRLVVRWTSVELPSGATVALTGAESAGRDGSGGLSGRVDARIWGVFGRALALSAIGAAAQLGQPQESAGFGSPASNRQIAAASVANELARAAADVVRQATEVRPVIRVPAGTPFYVFIPADFEVR
jgi:type IV secretory pathway VirB10-like protein